MSISDELYTRVFTKLRAVHPEPHLKRIANWVWIIVGLILSQSVHLSQIAQHIPSDAQAAGRIAQVRRWLKNQFIDVPAFYRPLITEAVQAWAAQEVFVILDGCWVNHEALQFFRLSLSHCFRTIPLTWLTVKGPGLITVEKGEALLMEAAQLLRPMASVTFCPCPLPQAGVGRCVADRDECVSQPTHFEKLLEAYAHRAKFPG